MSGLGPEDTKWTNQSSRCGIEQINTFDWSTYHERRSVSSRSVCDRSKNSTTIDKEKKKEIRKPLSVF